MMYCYNCGKEVGDAKFCPYCGVELYGEHQEGHVYQNKNEYEPLHQSPRYREEDASSFGFALLSFFIPIIGLILYIIWNRDYPLKAKSCLKGLIVGFVTEFVIGCCFFAFIWGAMHNDYDDYHDDHHNYHHDFYASAIVETVSYEDYF